MSFQLDDRLTADCTLVTDLELCKVLLMKDANYPWVILVPKVNNIKEIIELSIEQQALLWQESSRVSHVLQDLFTPDKLNVAAIGNVVSQLHVHHIARYTNDIAWPKPVWGQHPAKTYELEQLSRRVEALRAGLKEKQA